MFHLRNHSGRGPKGWVRSDERIHDEVCDILERHPYIDASEMEVRVQDGIVTLTGAIEDRPMKRRAEDAIEHVSGVKDVRNELAVKHTWLERMIDSAGGNEARNGNGLIGDIRSDSKWRPGGWPI